MKKLFLVTVLSGLLSVVRIVSGFVALKVVAVYTGPAGVAVLGQAQNMLGVLNGVVSAPGGSGVVRYTAEHFKNGFEACTPWWRAALLWIAFLVLLMALMGGALSAYMSNWLFGHDAYRWFILLALVALPLSSLSGLIPSVLNGLQDYKRFIALGAISIVCGTLTMVSLTVAYGVEGALIATAISPAVSGMVFLLGVAAQPWLRMRYWIGRRDSKALKGIGGYVLMAATSALTVPVSLLIVRNLLIDATGLDAAGHWQAVYKISEVYVGLITLALTTYYLPKLAVLVNKHDVYREVRSLALLFMPLLILAFFIIYSLKDFVIAILFTAEFSPAAKLLGLQLGADFFKILSWIYAYPMVSRGATKIFVVSEIAFSTSFVLLAAIFITVYGVKGVPIASLINYVMYFLFVYFLLPRLIRWG